MKVKLNDIEMKDYQSEHLQKLNNKCSLEGKKILEIGSDLECKTALGMLTLGAKEVWAVNPCFDDNFVSPDPRIHVIKSLGEKTKFKNQTFDIIFGIALLEHVLEPEKLFNECKRLLKQDGLCYLQGNPFWTSHWGHHIWTAKFKFGDETNPLEPWEHLCYENYEQMHNALKKKNFSDKDIKEFYNNIYISDNLSRIYPSEIKKIAAHIRGVELEIEQNYTKIPPNEYYNWAKNFISEEDLKTENLELYFVKQNRIKKFIHRILSIKNENDHKVFILCGIKFKFRLKEGE